MHRAMNDLLLCLVALLCSSVTISHSARLVESGYEVETIIDGKSLGISPSAIVSDTAGKVVFLLDTQHSNVWKLTLPLSQNSTKELLAGSLQGISGYADGISQTALFNHPGSLTIDGDSVLYMEDRLNHAIRRICDNVVTTIAGCNTSEVGHVDGPGKDARFSANYRVQYIPSLCSLLIADVGNRMIREIKMDEDCPSTADCKVVGDYFVDTIFDGKELDIIPYSIHASLTKDYLFVLDSKHSNILKFNAPVNQNSTVQHHAGSISGEYGYVDGDSEVALFTHPKSMTLDSKGNTYVADVGNGALRKISSTGSRVTTIAGGSNGTPGYVDGQGINAKFSTDFIVDYVPSTCSLLVLDKGNLAIRQIKLKVADCSSKRPMLSGRFWARSALALFLIISVVLLRKHIFRGLSHAWRIVLLPLKVWFHVLMQIPIQISRHSYAMRNMAAYSKESKDNFTEQPFLDQIQSVDDSGRLLDMDHPIETVRKEMPLFIEKHLKWSTQTWSGESIDLKTGQITTGSLLDMSDSIETVEDLEEKSKELLVQPLRQDSTDLLVSELSQCSGEVGSSNNTDNYEEGDAFSDSQKPDKLQSMIHQSLKNFEQQKSEKPARQSLNQMRR